MAEYNAEGEVVDPTAPQSTTLTTTMTTPTESNGVLTETAGREQFRADAQVAAWQAEQDAMALKQETPWESDPNRADLATETTRATGYYAREALDLAVRTASSGEPPEFTTARASAYLKWMQDND